MVNKMKAIVLALALVANASGQLIPGSPIIAGCPTGATCQSFTLNCPNIPKITGAIADHKPTEQVTGLVMFFSGDGGTQWWSYGSVLTPAFIQSLQDRGLECVEVKWGGNGWWSSQPGLRSGQEALGARPAAVIQWLHNTFWAPGTLSEATGNSAGAAQIAYALSTYNVDSLIDVAVLSSGPPLADICKACLRVPGYTYNLAKLAALDYGFGYPNGTGPCYLGDPNFVYAWQANSAETGGTKYFYPTTEVDMILGGQDEISIPNHALDYFNVLQAAGQNVTWQMVPKMGHGIELSSDGLAALYAKLTERLP